MTVSSGRYAAPALGIAQQTMFQSAPGTSAGRYQGRQVANLERFKFQSAPGTSAGRYAFTKAMITDIKLFQSAPGTSAGRYKAYSGFRAIKKRFNPRPARVPGDTLRVSRMLAIARRFNPRPARVPGDTDYDTFSQATAEVSIRARHECRAIHPHSPFGLDVSGFQSAPGTSAGRYTRTMRNRRSKHRFNPRPARVPGDTPSLQATELLT